MHGTPWLSGRLASGPGGEPVCGRARVRATPQPAVEGNLPVPRDQCPHGKRSHLATLAGSSGERRGREYARVNRAPPGGDVPGDVLFATTPWAGSAHETRTS